MTLIVGLNLSDRLYLGGDTRVSFSDGTFSDNIIKIGHISGDPYPLLGQKNPNTIFCAVAGDLEFADYLYQEVKDAIQNKEISDDIRLLYEQICDLFKLRIDKWLTNGNSYRRCCMIFGGMFSDRKKSIDILKLENLQKIFKNSIAPPDELQCVKKQLENDPFFQEMAKLVPNGKLMMPFDEPGTIVINPSVEKAIQNGDGFIDAPDSLIFSVQITEFGIAQEKAEWGEFLAYGTKGITKDHLTEEFLAQMELSPGQLVNQKDLMETGFIRDHIKKIALDKGIREIGGAVTPLVIRNNMYEEKYGYMIKTLAGEIIEGVYQYGDAIFFVDGKLAPIKLVDFYQYQTANVSAQL